jgi:hypothetical protein
LPSRPGRRRCPSAAGAACRRRTPGGASAARSPCPALEEHVVGHHDGRAAVHLEQRLHVDPATARGAIGSASRGTRAQTMRDRSNHPARQEARPSPDGAGSCRARTPARSAPRARFAGRAGGIGRGAPARFG